MSLTADDPDHYQRDGFRLNFGCFVARDVDIEARVDVEIEPGETLLFDPLPIHGSGRNWSNDFRRAVSVHYASHDCKRPESLRGSRPRKRRIAATMKDIPSSELLTKQRAQPELKAVIGDRAMRVHVPE